jgi:manganese-dependent inorganic pyrophosphatase
LVGAAATLIAEKFYKRKIEMSKESAVMLYSAIVSNTINLKNNITTQRDRKMASWLKSKFITPKNYVHQLFTAKSKFNESLDKVLLRECKFTSADKKMGIIQLEMIDAEGFILKNMNKILQNFEKIKKKKHLHSIFLTCIDVEQAKNIFVADDTTRPILEQTLKIKFKNNIAKRKGIIMRKELAPMLAKIKYKDMQVV